jgi:DNA-binding NarL/FixJ family response regulator
VDAARVVVADDDVLLREGVASLLAGAGHDVVGQASDAVQTERLVRQEQPDAVVLDIRMPPTNTTEGLEVARTIRNDLPQIALLLLSAHVEVTIATELLESGERIGYLLKRRVTNVDEFLDALQRVLNGGCVIDPGLVQELIGRRRRSDPLDSLTDREREVIALMAEGRSNSGIATRLWISESAVEKHVKSILAKLRLPASGDDHRRVLAVVTYLHAR